MSGFPRFMENIAAQALMAEVSATPKPGLVDRHDNGAHTDMNYDSFAASTAAIAPWLAEMGAAGYSWSGDPESLFYALRPLGIQAEKAMFSATGGVNTHKGIIFSMGLICAAAGWLYRSSLTFYPEDILDLCRAMAAGPLERDFSGMDPEHPRTHGERLFFKYGCRGIRGEAQSGFASVRYRSLPLLRRLKADGGEDNRIHLQVLLDLMAHVEDTNVLARAGDRMAVYVRDEARRLLQLGGSFTKEGMEALCLLNQDFIRKNISPGGCADLLAVTIFLEGLESHPQQRKKGENYETQRYQGF